VSSNFQHSICRHIQGSKHCQHLQRKHGWDNVTWTSINWATMKGSYLSLSPLQRIKNSKCIHGWLNTGWQKSKISPDAVNAHKCPCCLEADETQEHLLLCPAGSAHCKWYELIYSVSKDIIQNRTFKVQQLFVWCIRSWLESPETPQPDVSLVPEGQCKFVSKALEEQAQTGWHLAMHGYLSRHGCSHYGPSCDCKIEGSG
jgi:hypothetical protein